MSNQRFETDAARPGESQILSAISWNIHRGRGKDGSVDPTRILEVLRKEVRRSGTDALFLQEADAEDPPHRSVLDIASVETATGLRHVQTDPRHRSTPEAQGFQGVVAYLHTDIKVDAIRLVDLPGLWPRGAVVLDAMRDGQKLRLITTHLSLTQALRVVQLRTLGQHLDRFDPRPTLLCGDLNEWRPWGGFALSRRVLGRAFTGPSRATFPARWPVLPLDRVLVSAPGQVEQVDVLDGSGIRAASDHRPLWARIRLSG